MHLSRFVHIAIIAAVALSSSPGGKAKADCDSDMAKYYNNDKIVNAYLDYVTDVFTECLAEAIMNNSDIDEDCAASPEKDFQKTCEKEGYDFFKISGTWSCTDENFSNEINCLPKSCTVDKPTTIQTIEGHGGPDDLTNCKLVDVELDGIDSSGFSRNGTIGSLLALLAGFSVANLW